MAQAVGFVEILTRFASQYIDDVRWKEDLETSPALFFRAKSDTVIASIPSFTRPPEMHKWLTYLPPAYYDADYTPDEDKTFPITIPTGNKKFEICSGVRIHRDESGVPLYVPIELKYNSTTGDVVLLEDVKAGETIQLDFYADGYFEYALDNDQKQILGMCVALTWFQRFTNTWLNITPKIKDKSFDTGSESAQMTANTVKVEKMRSMLNDRMLRYEQSLAYLQGVPEASQIKVPVPEIGTIRPPTEDEYQRLIREAVEAAQKAAKEAEESAIWADKFSQEAKQSAENSAESAKVASDSSKKAEEAAASALQSKNDALAAASSAAQSASSAMNSAITAASKADLAERSAQSAYESEQKAKDSAATALESAQNAKASETAASESAAKSESAAQAAKQSEANALASEKAAEASATKASESADESAQSAANALKSETNAKASEDAAKKSAESASASETNAKNSETAAKTSETNASNSAQEAKQSEDLAAQSAEKSKEYADAAKESELAAAESAKEAAKFGAKKDFISSTAPEIELKEITLDGAPAEDPADGSVVVVHYENGSISDTAKLKFATKTYTVTRNRGRLSDSNEFAKVGHVQPNFYCMYYIKGTNAQWVNTDGVRPLFMSFDYFGFDLQTILNEQKSTVPFKAGYKELADEVRDAYQSRGGIYIEIEQLHTILKLGDLKSNYDPEKNIDDFSVSAYDGTACYRFSCDYIGQTVNAEMIRVPTKKYVDKTFANAIKASVSGEVISVDDVSPVEHEVECRVESKNLIPYPFITPDGDYGGGVMVTTENGVLTFNGVSTKPFYFNLCKIDFGKKEIIWSPYTNGEYVLSGHSPNIQIAYNSGNKLTFIYVEKGTTFDNLVIKPQMEKGTVATPYTPYVPDLAATKVMRCGKNLKNNADADTIKSQEFNCGYKDGFVFGKGTATYWDIFKAFVLNPGNYYAGITEILPFDVKILNQKTYAPIGIISSGKTNINFTIKERTELYITAHYLSNIDVKFNFMLELNTLTPYAPYQGETYTPSPDGTVTGMTSLSPDMTILSDTEGLIINAEYSADTQTVIDNAVAENSKRITAVENVVTKALPTDASLTVAGKAADSKAVGDETNAIKNRITPIEDVVTKALPVDPSLSVLGKAADAKAVGDELRKIAVDWERIQRDVRRGFAPNLYPVGTRFLIRHDVYGELPFEVSGYDQMKKVGDEAAHTMTLTCVPSVLTLQYGAPQALYACDTELSAGTYHFKNTGYDKWVAGDYSFTLTKSVPIGGQVCIIGYPYQGALTDRTISTYENQTATAPIESGVAIRSGVEGENLGETGIGNVNHPQRIAYGSNNYAQSAMRQFLNSESSAGNVWTPKCIFDRPPTWSKTQKGWLNGLDPDVKNVICSSVVKCGTNSIYENAESPAAKGSMYEVEDRIFLPSCRNVGFNIDLDDGTTVLPYYQGAVDEDRIKKNLSGTPVYWWIRTPYQWGANYVRLVSPTGTPNNGSADGALGVAPACNIG